MSPGHCEEHEELIKSITRIDERTKWLVKDRIESRDKINEHIETSEPIREQVKANSVFRANMQRVQIGLIVMVVGTLILMAIKEFMKG